MTVRALFSMGVNVLGGIYVLVLLPSSTNKLLAKWQGLYPVKKVISPVTYEVDHKKRRTSTCYGNGALLQFQISGRRSRHH